MCRLMPGGENPLGLYEVKEGDTAASVSSEHGILPQELVTANGLTGFPPAGSILLIPKREGEVYEVRAGETLASVCEKFHMTESEFSRLNRCSYVYPTQRVLVFHAGGGKDTGGK